MCKIENKEKILSSSDAISLLQIVFSKGWHCTVVVNRSLMCSWVSLKSLTVSIICFYCMSKNNEFIRWPKVI